MPDDLSEINTKIADLDERLNLLRERLLISNESLLKGIDSLKREIKSMKESLRELRDEIDKLKETSSHIISELGNLARKEELRILERYMKIWEPLKFVKKEEVEKMIEEAIKKTKE